MRGTVLLASLLVACRGGTDVAPHVVRDANVIDAPPPDAAGPTLQATLAAIDVMRADIVKRAAHASAICACPDIRCVDHVPPVLDDAGCSVARPCDAITLHEQACFAHLQHVLPRECVAYREILRAILRCPGVDRALYRALVEEFDEVAFRTGRDYEDSAKFCRGQTPLMRFTRANLDCDR